MELSLPNRPPSVAADARAAGGLGWRWSLVIWVYGLSLLLLGLGDSRALTRHEVLAAEPAREMITRGNWLIPTIGGVPRTIKPPTTGWLIAISMKCFGSDAEWVARLPAVLAGVGTAVVVAWLATRYFGRPAGVVAGLVQVTSYFTLLQARLAEADMLLCLAVTVAMSAFMVANISTRDVPRRTDRWLPWLFYFAAACSMLLKLLAGPAFIFSAVGLYLIVSRDRRAVRFLLSPIGIAIFLVTAFSWYAAAAVAYPPIVSVWHQETFGRFAGDVGDRGRDPLLFYVYNVPLMLLPWLPFAIGGIVFAWRTGLVRSPMGTFLLCWFAPGVLLLSASAWKAKHYAIPILPPFTIVAGVALWAHVRAQLSNRNPRHGLATIVLVVACFVAMIGVTVGVKEHRGPWLALVATIVIGGLEVIHAERRRSPVAEAVALFGTAWAAAAIALVFIVPQFDGYRTSAQFGLRVSDYQAKNLDRPVYMVGLGEAHVSYYLKGDVIRIDDLDAFVNRMREIARPDAYVVVGSAVDPETKRNTLDELGRHGTVTTIETIGDGRRSAGAVPLSFVKFSLPAPSQPPES